MSYLMGFIAPVPAANKAAYAEHAEGSLSLFKKLGVTRMVEAWGDDVPHGTNTDHYRAVDAQEGETIVYSFQEFPDKATADAANETMISDPDMAAMGESMPFDGRRMIWGGFEVVLDKRGHGATGYIDGSVQAVPLARRDTFVEVSGKIANLLVEHGAARVVDAWGDNVPKGERTDFPRSVKASDDEAVIFSFIEWPDKATRDAAWQAIFQDPRIHESARLFDESRRVAGGFVPLLDA